jgi:hypothetical protein
VLPGSHTGHNLRKRKGKSHLGNVIGNNSQDLFKILVTGHSLEKLKILKALGE